ncbi:MAG: hypothetical protein LV479_12610 [Methylacidiphilales bacterium]|nr:hypothetical protein [Candidatus Methylacidiphilales bacterium]
MAESPSAPPPFASASVPYRVDLRPLTTSELIDRGFILYRSHFAGLLLLALLCQIAPLLYQIMVTGLKLMPVDNEVIDHPAAFFQKMGLMMAFGFLTQIVVYGFEIVMTFYISDSYLGRIPSVVESLKKFAGRAWATLITCLLSRILIALTFLFPFLALAASYFILLFYPPTGFGRALVEGGVAILLLVASLAPVLIVFMRLWLTTSIVALERFSGWKAVRRSFQLVRYDPGLGIFYWGEMRLSFLLLPLFIIELLIFSLTSLPLVLFQIGETVRHGTNGQVALPPESTVILSQIMSFVGIALILPLYPIASTLFYYDVRIRREGFDLEFMASQLEGRV